MNNDWKDARKEYENIEIPVELEQRVQKGIRQGRAARRGKRAALRTAGAFAACFAVLFAGLNLSPVFATACSDVPVVGGLFRVLTVRSYTERSGDRTVEVSQPAVSGADAFAEKINAEIQERVDEKITEGNQLVSEYKEAFLSTGGTEAEWKQHDNQVSVTYEIKSQTDSTVSFVVDTSVSIASAYQEQFFYNLDVAGDRELTLQDVLGDDWVQMCNDSVRAQMAASSDPSVYFGADMGGFSTVDADTDFYLGADGNPVLVFPRATVAIGAMGPVEFEIQK